MQLGLICEFRGLKPHFFFNRRVAPVRTSRPPNTLAADCAKAIGEHIHFIHFNLVVHFQESQIFVGLQIQIHVLKNFAFELQNISQYFFFVCVCILSNIIELTTPFGKIRYLSVWKHRTNWSQ